MASKRANLDQVEHGADWLWVKASTTGLGRRRFLQLLSLGGAGAVLAACNSAESEVDSAESTDPAEASPWFKEAAPFIEHGGKNLEARLENMTGMLTPNDLFFVRNNSVSLDLDASSYRLIIEGDAVTNPLELSYEQLLGMQSRTVFSYIECGGNQRGMFDLVKGEPAKGTQWKTGGISMASWTGVPLANVLAMAGVQSNAVDVMLIGLDTESPEEGFRRAMPIEKALDPDTLLAYAMNGAILPKDHGFPIRGLVPGWVGSNNIKWLGRIVVSAEKQWSRNNTTSYVLVGDAYPPEGPADGVPATTQVIKSALALPWGAELSAGVQRISGFAHSPGVAISQVEWSVDGGASWNLAEITTPHIQYSWSRFEFTWDAPAGNHKIMTRATDANGNTQPDNIPFNAKGYLFNQPIPHPVTVS